MKTIYFDCFSGASGDMIIAALIDAGASERAITDAVRILPIDVWDLSTEERMKGGIRAKLLFTACDVSLVVRNHKEIVAMLERADLPARVRERALDAFRILAEAEARVHGVPVDSVHFHEVGSEDAIIDVVGACAALEDLGAERVVVSSIATGRGYTDSTHGTIPLPAPAVVEILTGAELYERGDRELITPTGAALLASWADSFGPMPPMTLTAVGYGAGTADLDWPNVLRVLVGESEPATRSEIATEILETNIDDMSPELIPYVIERVLEAGALDAWATPVHMKKGRIGAVLSILIERGDSQAVLDVLFRETTTFGVRISTVDREVLDRKEVDVTVAGQRVRIKVGYRHGEVVSAAPEYEDAAAAARATGMALKDVYRAALEGFEDR
jgi:uncharacterized protein (TIGR00299 family) protein